MDQMLSKFTNNLYSSYYLETMNNADFQYIIITTFEFKCKNLPVWLWRCFFKWWLTMNDFPQPSSLQLEKKRGKTHFLMKFKKKKKSYF